jgi:hypothetical protein
VRAFGISSAAITFLSLRVRQFRTPLIEPLQKLAMLHQASSRESEYRDALQLRQKPTHNSDSANGFVGALAILAR